MVKGRTEARLYTEPLRELTPETSLGFACIEYAEDILGNKLYPWQKWALIHALEITGDCSSGWMFRYRTIVFLLSRQNGKTLLSKVIVSFFLNVLGVQSVFGTSLSLDKAEEVWEAVIADQESVPELKRSIDRVSRTNGNKRLILTEQRQYKVGAPTRRAGRGDSNDLVMLDEIRELRDFEVLSASFASTNAKPNGLVMCFSNAGDPDSGAEQGAGADGWSRHRQNYHNAGHYHSVPGGQGGDPACRAYRACSKTALRGHRHGG